MKHVKILAYNSEDLDVIVKGKVTGKSVNSADEVLYQIETPCGDCFEANEECVYPDVTKPVEVPQCVIDWYEDNKDNLDYNLWNYIIDWDEQEPSEFKQWIDESNKAFETIVNMHQFGYKVEKEKHYKIKIIKTGQYLYKNGKDLFFSSYSRPEYNPRLVFTKEELEQENSDWVFDCPGIEVEELE